MTEKRYNIIWDFCDWLSYQGLAYETLHYGSNKDLDNLIKRYLDDKEWFNNNKRLCEHIMDVFSEYYMEYDFIIYFKDDDCKTIEIKKEWLISWEDDELVMYYYEDDEKMLDKIPLGCIIIPKIFAIVRKNE